MTEERTLELPALGRPMQLGMLYDCRSDTPIPGMTLWDPATLHGDCNVILKPATQFSIISSDEVEDKTSALKVEAALKASFLGGLVDVKGSAKYLNDTKSSKRQSRVTLHYEATTRFEQLSMKHLGRHNVQHADVFDQGTATHVVTGILYGAKAFFVFDRDCTINENLKDVQGQLYVLVKKVPSFEIDGAGSVTLSDEETKEQTSIRCTFHGDFTLGANPSNYEEAIDVYKQLPTLIGKNGENAVSIRVWLYPLAKLDDRSAKLVREISVNLISDSQNIIEGLDRMQVKCNDTMKQNIICKDFPQFVDNIDSLKKLLLRKKLSFRQFLARVLPKIRGGKVQESELYQAVVDFEQCPFNLKQVGDWLSSKEKEMSAVKAYVRAFDGIQIISSRADLEALVMDPLIDCIVCFAFPLIGHEDEYLTALLRYLQSNEAGSYIPAKGWFDDVSASKDTRRYAKSFVEFYQTNSTNSETIFAVTGFDDDDTCLQATVGGSMFLYEHGVLTTKTFEPPGKPVQVTLSDKSHNYVSLEWQPPSRGVSELQHYIIKYRDATVSPSGSTDWTEVQTDGEERDITIMGLVPFTSYEFNVASVCRAGVSQVSETTLAETCSTSPPTRLRKHQASENSISIEWNQPSQIGKGLIIENYLVKFRQANGPSLHEKVNTSSLSCFFTVDGLHADTRYEFLVSAVCSGSVAGSESGSIEIDTGSSQKTEKYAHKISKGSLILSKGCVSKGEPAILQLPLNKVRLESSATYRSYSFGEKFGTCLKQKVIMIVGATGAGKSTLINGMINYILNVEWQYDFRFKIVDDEADGTSKSQTQSQTQIITTYTIYKNTNHTVPYTLTIIDTPGFGDTRGITRDKAIINQIRDFFSHSDTHQIDHIDGIGFVAQSSQARLTSTQRYVFDSILSVFGKDISPNILLLVTFADGQKPPVIAAIREADIPCSNEIFKFNNSALFANNKVASADSARVSFYTGEFDGDDDANTFDRMFWRMGLQSMKSFFIALNKLESRSLSLTKEVLEERNRLEVSVEGLQPQIQMGVCKIEELRLEHKILEQHEVDIDANKDFNYEVEVPQVKQIDISDTGEYITNCSKCHFTCHFPCGIADDKGKRGCWAITGNNCRVCPGKCIWNVHFNQQYRFEFYSVKEKRSYTELEERYKDATGKKLTVEQVIRKHEEEFLNVQHCVFALIKDSYASLKRLEEIALKPNPLSTVDYVDLLIESEKSEAKPGWQSRMRALGDVRKQADIIGKVKQANFDPFANMYKKDVPPKSKDQKTKSWWDKIWAKRK